MENEKQRTGYPSIDKPWLKYYTEEIINKKMPSKSAYQMIYDANKDSLDSIALVFENKKITYGELFEKIDQVANSFSCLGIKTGDIVSVCLANIPETAYIFYALNKFGAICDFIDPRATPNVMKEHLNLAKSSLLVTISDCYSIFSQLKCSTNLSTIVSIFLAESILDTYPNDKIEKIENSIRVDKSDMRWNDFINLGSTTVSCNFQSYDLDLPITILHTGGSTGEPKGALLSNNNLNALVTQWMDSGIKYEKHNKLLSLMPPFVSFGMAANLHVPLVNSMEIIMIPKYEPKETLDLIRKYKPNCIPASPAHWEYVFGDDKAKSMDWSFLKVALMGGDILNPYVEEGLNEIFSENGSKCKFIKAYGMTETSTALSITFDERVNISGSVGAPLPKTNIKIIDLETGIELPYNKIGEICALTPNRMVGYYEKPAETSMILRKHNDGEIWVHTGDLGFADENGILFVKGRIKRIIIRFDGIKIYPADIEAKLMQIDAVKKCAVVGKKDKEHFHGENPIAFIVKNQACWCEGCIESFCEKNIIDYAIPTQYIYIDDLPYTKNGKVDYRALEQQAENAE